MNQHLHIITLGVRDFETSKKFYAETLGWKISRLQEDIAFFQTGGVVLAIYPRDLLAEDAVIAPKGSGFAGFTLAYNAQSESEVDGIIKDLKSTKSHRRHFGADTVLILPTPMITDGKLRTTRSFHLMRMEI